MNVVIDVGNTRVKYAFFEENTLLESGYGWEQVEKRMKLLKEQGQAIFLLLSGSSVISEQQVVSLKNRATLFVEASVKLPLPLKIAYLTPETLGFDRIANCIGAMKLFPGQPLLVIDSGTCITLNWVSADGVFRGGNISPGVEMRFKSLHHYTAKLPCLAPAENYGEVGQTTETAIVNGVMRGVFFEVQSYITQFCREEPDAVVVMTGGNAHFWESSFVEKCFFCKELGLIGLNEVLEKCKKE